MEQPPQSKSDIHSGLIALERILHHPSNEVATADFENLLAADFWEVGASGRPYTRADALRVLETRHANPQPCSQRWDATDVRCQQLAADLYLLTYTLFQDHGCLTRRATIWQRASHGWQIVFHQGTIVGESAGTSPHVKPY